MAAFSKQVTFEPIRTALCVCATISMAFAAAPATPSPANTYLVHNLVSDLPDVADFQDPNLVNPWGIATTASSPFWLGNNGTGTSTLYGTNGAIIPLVVQIPTPTSATGGAVSGVIANTSTFFTVTNGTTTKAASFLFCTEDGTVSGWSSSVNPSEAIIAIDQSGANSVFKGCVIGGTAANPVLFVADFHNGVVDMFDSNFHPLISSVAFVDPTLPAGYAPFNLFIWGGNIYVAYALQDDEAHDDVAGPGNGYLDEYDGTGNFIGRLVSQGALNSPWGMAIAPASFGAWAGSLLVGNFGDGHINVYDPAAGTWLGALQDSTGNSVTISGLWGLLVGNGGRGGDTSTLYFTAGIPGPYGEPPESHGLFGSIQPAAWFASANVENGASFGASLAPNTWASIVGGALATTVRSWAATDFSGSKLPVTIDGVSVTVNGEAAGISYVSPSQLNFLIPTDTPMGTAQVQVNNNGVISPAVSVDIGAVAPAFFWFTGGKYIAATHANGTLSGPTTLIAGVTTPAAPGETISIWGNGFGVTSPAAPNEAVVPVPLPLVTWPTVTIGGLPANVTYAGLSGSGVFQINVTVPAGLGAGDAAVVATTGGQESQAAAYISVN